MCSMNGEWPGIPTRGINGPDISEITEDNCFVIGRNIRSTRKKNRFLTKGQTWNHKEAGVNITKHG